MAALFGDTYDHYLIASQTRKWTQARGIGLGTAIPQITSAAGVRGTYGLRLICDSSAGSLRNSKSLGFTVTPGDNTYIAGTQFRTNNLVNLATVMGTSLGEFNAIFQCIDTTTYQLRLSVMQDGRLTLTTGGNAEGFSGLTTINTSTFAIQTNTFYYIWLKAVIANSGSYKVVVNGDTWMEGTADTQASSNPTYSQFVLGPCSTPSPVFSGAAFDFDDTVFLDGTGAINNDILCPVVRGDALFATGAGDLADWTPNASTNVSRIQEGSILGGIDADDDVTYNEASTVGEEDVFIFPDLPVPGATIKFVQSNLIGRRTDAGASSVASVFHRAGISYPGTGFGQSSTYLDNRTVWNAEPDTSGAWTEAGFNAGQFGYRKTA